MSPNPATWMTDNYEVISGKTFGQIIIPGSHGSGMSELHGTPTDIAALAASTQTQNLNVYDQLVSAGMRCLDLCIVSYGASPSSDVPSGYYAAHYTDLTGSTWQGLMGQSLGDICQDLQRAIAQLGTNEVVFIALSRGNQLVEGGPWQPLGVPQRIEIVGALLGALGSNVYQGSSGTNLSTTSFGALSSGANGPLFLLWDDDGSYSGTAFDERAGFFTDADIPSYDSYFATDDQGDFLSTMQNLVGGWATDPQNTGQLFRLSWYLTASSSSPGSLQEYASSLNPQLTASLDAWQTQGTIPDACRPNFAIWDFVSDQDLSILQACVDLIDPVNWMQCTGNTSPYRGPLSNSYFNSDPVMILPGYTLQAIGTTSIGNQICLSLTVSNGSDTHVKTGQPSGNYIELGNNSGCSGLYASLNPSMLGPHIAGIDGVGFVLTSDPRNPDNPYNPNRNSSYDPGNQICLAIFSGGNYVIPEVVGSYSQDLGGLYLNENVVACPPGSVVIGTRLYQQGNQIYLSIAVSPAS